MTETPLRIITRTVAQAMGGKLDADEGSHCTHIVTAQGPILWTRLEGKRLSVSASWPTYKDAQGCPRSISMRDFVEFDDRSKFTASITVCADRDPKAIARDIERRLMPDVITLHARALAYCTKQETYLRDYANAVAKLAKETGGRVHSGGDRTVYISGGPELRVDGPNSVRVERLDVTASQAIAIVKLLKQMKAA